MRKIPTMSLMAAAYHQHCKRAKRMGFKPLGPLHFVTLTNKICFEGQ